MKNLTGLLALFFIGTSFLYSQSTSPTLQAGLSGIAFDKGDLDAEVIAKLIAEKQDEIKVRLIQTMLLDDLDEAGGLISAYVNDLLNVVLSGSKPQVQTKNILESTVNVAVVLAFVNHYVGVIDGDARDNLNKLAMSLGYILPEEYKSMPPPSSLVEMIQNPKYAQVFTEKLDDDKVSVSDYNSDILTQFAVFLIDMTAEALQQNETLKERGLFRFTDSQWYISENLFSNSQEKTVGFTQNAFFRSYIDLRNKAKEASKLKQDVDSLERRRFDQILSNDFSIKKMKLSIDNKRKKLQTAVKNKSREESILKQDVDSLEKKYTNLKLSNDSRIQKIDSLTESKRKEFQTAFNQFRKLQKDLKEKGGAATSEYAQLVFQDIQEYINAYVDAFGVFDFIYRNGLQISSIDTLLSGQLDSLANSLGSLNPDINIDISRIEIANYQKLVNHLKKQLKEIPEKYVAEFSPFFAEIEDLLIKSTIETGGTLKNHEQIFLIGKKLLPVARTIVTLSGDTSSVELVLRKAELQLVANAVDSLSVKLGLSKKDSDSFMAFYKLFGSIQNLDDIQSYEQFFKSFYLTLDVFVDGKLKSVLQKVVGLTNDHIELVKTDSADYVNVDVQGVLASLSEMKYNRWRPFSLYLTVGGNFMWFPGDGQQVQENNISGFQYFGEKIGLKIKLKDNAYLNSFSKGEVFNYYGRKYIRKVPPKQPVVSDYHFLLYASGLLYNLVGTSSENSINSTMVGAGFGLSFFNGLDFNVSAGMPVGISNPKLFINAGFEIRFMEYIQALGK